MPSLHERAEEIRSKVLIVKECWEYPTERRAYLTVNGVQTLVYRIMFEEAYGPPAPGMYILHKCDNKHCCNPGHLEQGTQRENVKQAVERGLVSSNSPLAGISWQSSRERWLVMPRINGRKTVLYAGKDFFEAACKLLSWRNNPPALIQNNTGV